ncbi:hypothetical protein ACTMU2_13935 [Cupriavidus basilensis]
MISTGGGRYIADKTIRYAGVDPGGGGKPVERVLIKALNHASLVGALRRAPFEAMAKSICLAASGGRGARKG